MSEPIALPIKFKVKEIPFKKDAVEYFKEHKKLRPVRFGYSIHYAEVLEYGCGPLNDYQPTVDYGDYTYKSIYDQIYKWAGEKDGKGSGLPIEDEKERRAFAKKVTDKFFRVGMRAHPYWRPAMQWLQDNMQRLFDEGYSLYEIAGVALRISDECIMAQNLPFKGRLQLSVVREEVDPRELNPVKDKKDWTDEDWERRFDQFAWR